MTGLNQTLLLAISMLGIAALMGAGGLGLLVFRATNNLDVALGASAGLALFTVAVVLDRISQTQATDGMNLFTRLNRALANRRNPELLLAEEEQAAKTGAKSDQAGSFALVTATESRGALISAIGAVVALVSTLFLTWSEGGSKVGSFARRRSCNRPRHNVRWFGRRGWQLVRDPRDACIPCGLGIGHDAPAEAG